MATLFDTSKQNISLHIKNVLAEGELAEAATVKESLTVQTEGKRQVRRTNLLYNLDMILAVGCDAAPGDQTIVVKYGGHAMGEEETALRLDGTNLVTKTSRMSLGRVSVVYP
jgi:hypothetical protein